MQAAINWALSDTNRNVLYLAGNVWVSSDLLNLHDVQIIGPGTVKVAAGPTWYVQPSFLNTGFSPLGPNTLYINSTIGNDANSGLSDAFPVQTVSRAQKIIGRKASPAQGYYQILIAQCVITPADAGLFIDAQGSRATPIMVRGPIVAELEQHDTAAGASGDQCHHLG